MKNILLIGANFTNKGAEAMALTAIERLHQMYPQCRITVASYAEQESLPYGHHTVDTNSPLRRTLSFELIKNPRLTHLRADIVQLLRVLCVLILPHSTLKRCCVQGDSYLQRMYEADLLIDLSGFAMSDQRELIRRLVFCFEIFTGWCLRKPYVVFTQALGPFTKLSTRLLAQVFLPKAALIIARGEQTFAHLKAIGITRQRPIPICPDSAFLFPAASPNIADAILANAGPAPGPLFGIIPNINIFHRIANTGAEEHPYIRFLVRLHTYAETELGATVIFICHEQRGPKQRDDAWLIQQVLQHIASPCGPLIVSADHSASELKAVIGRLDFVVASRYHSIIAAISQAVPFLIVSWAHKYDELVTEINMPETLFNFQTIVDREFFFALHQAWKQRETTQHDLRNLHHRLYAAADKAFQLIQERWPDDSSPAFDS